MVSNDNEPLCVNCFYFTPIIDEKTLKEEIEEENKPKPIGFRQFIDSIFNPEKYERGYSSVDEVLDYHILSNRQKGLCRTDPEIKRVWKNSFCRHFKLKGS